MEATLFLELLDDLSLSLLLNSSGIKKSLGKAVLVVTLKNVLVLQISEDLDDFVNLVGNLGLVVCLEVLLELIIQVRNQRASCLLILIDKRLKRGFDGQIDSLISLK